MLHTVGSSLPCLGFNICVFAFCLINFRHQTFAKEVENVSDVPLQRRPPIILIPGYEGSIFTQTRAFSTDKSRVSAIFLAPVTDKSSADLSELLAQEYQGSTDTYTCRSDVDVVEQLGDISFTEYPEATCAPHSSIAHCIPVPAQGPISRLAQKLTVEFGYVNRVSLFGAAYDWRLPTHHLLHSKRPGKDLIWGQRFKNLVMNAVTTTDEKHPALLVAHGYGCVLVSRFLAEMPQSWRRTYVMRLWCLAGPLGGSAAAAMEIFTGYAWHSGQRTLKSHANAHEVGRLDFRTMEFELGLRRARRVPLPQIRGVWDNFSDSSKSWRLTPPSRGLLKLKRSFGSLIAMIPSDSRRQILAKDTFKIVVNDSQALFANIGDMIHIAVNALRDQTLARHMDRVMRREVNRTAVNVGKNAHYSLKAPCVPVHCAYGSNLSTPGALRFQCTDMSCPPTIDMVSGDGIIEDLNGQLCNEWASTQEESVNLELLPGVQHFDLVSLSSSLFAYLEQLGLRSLDSTPTKGRSTTD